MKQTLLIADDDAELCDICRKFFTKLGYEVETAADGLDCLEKLRRRTPAVLVLDLGLRWGGGDGVLARLREESALPAFPVVLTATAGYLLEMPALIEPPVVDRLHKPFALNALLESVRSALVSRGRREPSGSNGVAAYPELFLG